MNFILGLVSDFELTGYTITSERKSNDGTLTLVHINVLGDWVANNWGDERFTVLKNSEVATLLETAEWKQEV